MPARRSYADHGDACAAAHGIEVIGEVWTYPIVREMFLGPKRFGELLDLVRGITPAVLTTRLRELAAKGLVTQVELVPPARGRAYQLTEWGHALEPVVEGVARWAHASPTWRVDGGLTPDGVVLAMRTMAPDRRPPAPVEVQLDLADGRLERPETYSYRLTWDQDGFTVARGRHDRPGAILRGDSTAWARVLFGGMDLAAAPLAVTGDTDTARELARAFRPCAAGDQ